MPTTRSKANSKQGDAVRGNDKVTTGRANANQPQSDRATAFTPPNLKITNLTGDLTIDPPENSIVIHSVNCLGEWGSGVALALAKALPGAYRIFKDHCKQHTPDELLGSAFLISPQKEDYDLTFTANGSPSKPRRWVYCLFVSKGYGRPTKMKPGKSKTAEIIQHTRKALEDVRHTLSSGQVGNMADWGTEETAEHRRELKPILNVIWACKFNSGSFGVKWETTLAMIKDILEGRNGDVWHGEIRVISHD